MSRREQQVVPFLEAVRVWAKIGLLSFGGPAGQIALMHRTLVDEKRWIDEDRFLHALNYCMLLPGPEAQQLAIYIGWMLHRYAGGLAAGILFVLPGALVVLLLSILYAMFGHFSLTQAIFFGIKVAVLAVIVEAIFKIGKRALKGPLLYLISVCSFVSIFFFNVSFPLVVFAAGLVGFIGYKLSAHRAPTQQGSLINAVKANTQQQLPVRSQSSAKPALMVTGVCLALWLLPVFAIALWLGTDHVYAQEGAFFSKMAVVTFGGAYAVLAYVAQQAVETYGWLEPGEMLDGLGLAETTPGPLILVVQFVGFLAAYRNPGMMDPLLAGTLGALLTTWVTFVPCFLWIFLGAPFVESLRENRALNAAMSAITAAVVGVIINLAIWFALHVLFKTVTEVELFGGTLGVPVLNTLEPFALILTIAALVAMLRYKIGVLPTLAVSTLLGTLYQWF